MESPVKRILINATNLTGSGAVAVGLSLLPSLVQSMAGDTFSLLLPDQPAFRALSFPDNVGAVFFRRRTGYLNDLDRLRELLLIVSRIAREMNADICLTLGDLAPMGLACPSVLFLQQSLLAYDRNELAGLAGWHGLKSFGLRNYFALTVRRNARVVVQTQVMAERLAKSYRVDPQRISVIPQPVPQHVTLGMRGTAIYPRIAACSKPIKLLFLAAYYPHKNHRILPFIVEELRHRNLTDKVQVFLTLDEARVPPEEATKWLNRFPEVVTNLGRIPSSDVAAACRTATALFMPTLVESYGLIYLEAMACGLPILTSDRDFAHWICQDLALYFDPLDVGSIVDAVEALPSLDVQAYRSAASQRLKAFPRDWTEVAQNFADILVQGCPTVIEPCGY